MSDDAVIDIPALYLAGSWVSVPVWRQPSLIGVFYCHLNPSRQMVGLKQPPRCIFQCSGPKKELLKLMNLCLRTSGRFFWAILPSRLQQLVEEITGAVENIAWKNWLQ